MTRRLARLPLLAVLTSSLAVPRAAYADPPKRPADASKRDEAARIKAAADTLMDEERYADALGRYQRAYDLSADPAILYNMSRALEAIGEYPEALDKLEQFEADAPPALRQRVPALTEHIGELRARIATVLIKSNAPGARVLVRQKAAGVIDRELRVRTRAGAATIEITADGYEPWRRDVDLAAGSTITIDARLTPKTKDALVVVKTSPAADIAIDGRAIGRAPLEVRLGPGAHELVAHSPGHVDEKVQMSLSLGDRRDVSLELQPTPPVTAKWWFWTAIGVVVAGGVATTIALTTERKPSNGSFTPGRVPAP